MKKEEFSDRWTALEGEDDNNGNKNTNNSGISDTDMSSLDQS